MRMKTRFRLIHRGERGNQFYCVDSETGRRFSLKTKDRDAAMQIVLAKNQSLRQPALNLQIAKAYLAGTDNGVTTRTWRNAIEALTDTKQGANKARWLNVAKDRALAPLASRASRSTATATHGRNAPRPPAIPNGLHRRLWVITAKPCIVPTRNAP